MGSGGFEVMGASTRDFRQVGNSQRQVRSVVKVKRTGVLDRITITINAAL